MIPPRSDLRLLLPEHRWRWTEDHEKGARFDPWHVEIPCKYGAVYLHAAKRAVILQAWISSRRIFNRAVSLKGVRAFQSGEEEGSVLFAFADAAPVLALLRARRKRLPSANQRLPPRRTPSPPLPPPL